MVVLLVRGPKVVEDKGRHVEATRSSALPATRALALRQLRASAASFGISEDKLIAQLRTATTAARITMLCDRLAVVGTDRAVDALAELAGDRRTGVPSSALKAIGKIGTDSAVRFLLAYERDGIPRHRGAAVAALGNTGSRLAAERLTEIALSQRDAERTTAISALADIGGSDVVDTLAAIAESGADYYTTRVVIRSLSDIDREDAQALLLELARSDDPRVQVEAIDYLEFSAAGDTRAILLGALASPDAEVAGIAAKTLARQGVSEALPAITKLALSGPKAVRLAAIEAIGILDGDGSHEILGELLEIGSGPVKAHAASALGEIGDDDAIDILVSAAYRAPTREAAIGALRSLRGPAIENAMVDVAQRGRPYDRTTAREYLIDVGHPRALELLISAARNTAGFERSRAISMLADHKTERATDALLEIASSTSGDAKMEAIAALVASGEKVEASDMLVDVLASGDKREMRAAAASLAKLGDADSRDALLTALKSGHGPAAAAAAEVVLELDGGAEVRAALVKAAEISPQVRLQVIEKLVEEGASEGLELARQALASEDEASDTAYALARSDNPDARALLMDAARDASATTRAHVASALAYPESPAATEALVALTRDEDATVRENAISSLASVASEDAVETLIATTVSDDARDRKLAIEALARADSQRARDSLAELISRGDDADALAAISSGAEGSAIASALMAALDDYARTDKVRAAAAEQLKALGVRLSDSQTLEIERLLESS